MQLHACPSVHLSFHPPIFCIHRHAQPGLQDEGLKVQKSSGSYYSNENR